MCEQKGEKMDWLFNRALRLPHAVTVKIAKALRVDPALISAYNDAFAGIVGQKAVEAAGKIAPQ